MDLTTAQPKDHAAGFTPRPTESLAHQLLAALAQHRLASTHQLRLLLRPNRSRQSVSQRLNDLLGEHLVDFVVLPQSHRTRIWYLTPKVARLTRDWPALRSRPPYPITSATAASLKTPHTLTVLRTHLAFVADARQRGDEHGHLDWTPEVFHAIGDQDRLVADAVMHYTLIEGEQRCKLRAFVEIDRATMSSERLAAKLIEYARLWTYEPQPAGRRRQTGQPGWLRWYPVFPRVLFVLTGASRQTMDNRISDLKTMATHHPLVAGLAREIPLGAAVLDDLDNRGPTCDVWTPLAGDQPRPWTQL
ncbi:replication-relaxation family protein [Streptomyces sp. NPDC052107]|uniref:replication-relaxation family protein n=1 Tax=Streptomyces sp. NPDC052107 TaxID=3155632 RepID=UPI00343FDAA0